MPTLINTQEAQAPAQGSSNAGGDNNALMKISAGPAALAQLLIYEIMQLYGQILALDQKQKVSMVQAQSKEAQASAQATIAGGQDQAIMYGVMGGLSIAGAAAGFGMQTYMQRNATGQEVFGKENAEAANASSMKNVEKALSMAPDEAVMNGETETRVNSLKDAFARGDFVQAKDDSETRVALQKLKQDKDAQGVDEWNKWKTEFGTKSNQATMNHNSATQVATAYQQKMSTYKELINQVFTAGSNVGQAVQTAAKAQHDAETSLQQSASQMAGAASSDLGQAANKAFESQNAEIQVLENINRTNSVNG